MRRRPVLASILVIIALLTSPSLAIAQEIDFQTGGDDADCWNTLVGAWAQIYEEGEPVQGVPVTLTLGGDVQDLNRPVGLGGGLVAVRDRHRGVEDPDRCRRFWQR